MGAGVGERAQQFRAALAVGFIRAGPDGCIIGVAVEGGDVFVLRGALRDGLLEGGDLRGKGAGQQAEYRDGGCAEGFRGLGPSRCFVA